MALLRELDSDAVANRCRFRGTPGGLRGTEEQTLSEGLPQLPGHPLHGLGRDLSAKVAVEWRWSAALLDSVTFTAGPSYRCILTIQTQRKGWTDLPDGREYVYLLHVSQHILPAVKHSFTLLCIQLVDKVSSVVFIGVLVPKERKMNLTIAFSRHIPLMWRTTAP